MKLTILGSGTSTGVPSLGCDCEVCRSRDPRDKRLRSVAMVETDTTRVLIDSGPDIRQQLLSVEFKPIDAVLLTHIHYDHVAGIDDLRPFCQFGAVNIYANRATSDALHQTMPYCFVENLYPGAPQLNLHIIEPHNKFRIGDLEITPIEVMHGQMPILGFTFNEINVCEEKTSETTSPQLVYITDMKTIADDELQYIAGVDTLIVNCLRFGHNHHSHQNAEDACQFAVDMNARRCFLIHLSHGIGLHAASKDRLPHNVRLAYDGMSINI